ncbi:MAG: transposase [Myxococcales bacterium]|nr:transposase [Myxococcales bacterium]
MGEDAISKDQGEDRSAALQLLTPLADVVRGTLMEFVVTVVMEALKKMLEEDRTRLCGRAYDRDRGAQGPSRAGSCTSSLVLGGRKVGVRRPRVRDANGEVALPTWQAFAAEDPLRQRVLEQMLIGVATRRYERSLEPVPKTVKQRSTSKSTVSRKFIRETSKTVHKILKRDLRPLTIAAVMLDGIHVGDHVLLVALGIDEQGSKHHTGSARASMRWVARSAHARNPRHPPAAFARLRFFVRVFPKVLAGQRLETSLKREREHV